MPGRTYPTTGTARLVEDRTKDRAPATGITAESRMMALRHLAMGVAPTAKREVSVTLDEDGINPGDYRYTVKLYGPDVLRPVVQSGPTPEEAFAGLGKAWAAARRAKDIDGLIRELGRLRGAPLDEGQQEYVTEQLNTTNCPTVSAYNNLAAKYRTHAKAHPQAA